MHILAGMMLCAAVVAGAQTAETVAFRAILDPQNETGSGGATVLLHVVREANAREASAIANVNIRYSLPAGTPVMAQLRGAAGALPIGSFVAPEGGEGRHRFQASLPDASQLLGDPRSHTLVLTTPRGVLQGALQPAEIAVVIAQMDASKTVPSVGGIPAGATAGVLAILTRDAARRATSGHVFFDVAFYDFPAGTLFTGLHIHAGRAGINGPPLIDSGLEGGARAVETATGAGRLVYEAEVNRADPAALNALAALADDPASAYANLHTINHPEGAVRGQFRTTDAARFLIDGPGSLTLHTIRDASGAAAASVAVFDVHHAPAVVTEVHAGSLAMPRLAAARTDGGERSSHTFAMALIAEGQLAEALLSKPEDFFVTTETNAGRDSVPLAMLGVAAPPRVEAVIAAVSDPALTRLAPGGLFTVFGSHLVKTPGDVGRSFDGSRLPAVFNGTRVSVGELIAPMITVTPEYIVAQIPFEAQPQDYTLTVRIPEGTSNGRRVRVAANAPALYFDGEGGLFTTTSYQLAGRSSRPARRNELLWGFVTGVGQLEVAGAAPPPQTGRVVATPVPYSPNEVEWLVDGCRANATLVASPGFAGLYQVLFAVPAETRSGVVDVQTVIRGAASNKVRMQVQ